MEELDVYAPQCVNQVGLYFERYMSSIVPRSGELVELEFGIDKSNNLTFIKYFLVEKTIGRAIIVKDIIRRKKNDL